MPEPDHVPSPRNSAFLFFWRIFRLLALLSIVIAGIAVVLVARGDPAPHTNMLIATALGIGLTVLVGTGLVTLAFISSSSGHDDVAAGPQKKKDEE
jgi:hypothetical protein